jgi:hypothetical protein
MRACHVTYTVPHDSSRFYGVECFMSEVEGRTRSVIILKPSTAVQAEESEKARDTPSLDPQSQTLNPKP